MNGSFHSEGSTDLSNQIHALIIENSSSIVNGTTVNCEATNNGTVVESSNVIQVILQGTGIYYINERSIWF